MRSTLVGILCSAAGLALGYFVGKTGDERRNEVLTRTLRYGSTAEAAVAATEILRRTDEELEPVSLMFSRVNIQPTIHAQNKVIVARSFDTTHNLFLLLPDLAGSCSLDEQRTVRSACFAVLREYYRESVHKALSIMANLVEREDDANLLEEKRMFLQSALFGHGVDDAGLGRTDTREFRRRCLRRLGYDDHVNTNSR